jgi:L-iditol 2-dehydrogenase
LKAAYLVEPKRIELRDIPVPTPGPGEVLVRVRAVGVCGSDVHYYLDGHIGETVASEPLVMGHEFAGEVAGLGAGVAGLELGQRVAVEPAIACGHCEMCELGHPNLCFNIRFMSTPPDQGALAEYVLVSPERCFLLPDSLSFADGAMMEPLGVALHTLRLAKLFIGDSAAVVGCGAIGLLVLQLMRASGALSVIASDKLDYRLEYANRYGASLAINVGREDPVAAVSAFTHGRGVDVVAETAGTTDAPEQAARLARNGGTVLLVGIPPENRFALTASVTRRKGLTLKAIRRMKHTYPRAIALTDAGKVDVRGLVTHHFSLEQADDAFALVASVSDGVIKAMIDI